MDHAMHKRPGEISGGMTQRVGIARTLAMLPEVLLMDEPFGTLDALTRVNMQDSLMESRSQLNNTVIMITHDVDEAVLLFDNMVMMTNGPEATVDEIFMVDLQSPRNRLALAQVTEYNLRRSEVLKSCMKNNARENHCQQQNKYLKCKINHRHQLMKPLK